MSDYPDFGREIGLIHQITLKGRDLGLGREWWKQLLKEEMLAGVAEFMSTKTVLHAEIIEGGSFAELVRKGRFTRIDPGLNADIVNTPSLLKHPWKLEFPDKEEVACSMYFRYDHDSEDKVREGMMRWGLRPANAVEIISFASALRDYCNEIYFVTSGTQVPIERGMDTHIIALDATRSPKDSREDRLGIRISTENSFHMDLDIYCPNHHPSFWKTRSYARVFFLAVPIE